MVPPDRSKARSPSPQKDPRTFCRAWTLARDLQSVLWYNPLTWRGGGRMERHETAELFSQSTTMAIVRPTLQVPQISLIGLAGIISLLLLCARMLPAETAAGLNAAMPGVAIAPAEAAPTSLDGSVGVEVAGMIEIVDSSDLAVDAVEALDDTSVAVDVSPESRDASRAALADVLFVRGLGPSSWRPRTTDEILAAAIARGTNRDLEPLNAFRKRSRDLFRTERPVSIGNAEMLLRLRLRAKAKRAVSVELRF